MATKCPEYSVSNLYVTREVSKNLVKSQGHKKFNIGFDPTVNCLSDSAVVCA